MVKYVGKSRVDGYLIVEVSKDNDGDLFLEHFRNLKYGSSNIRCVSRLDGYENENSLFVKIASPPIEFKKELSNWEKNLRKQKLDQINELNKK